MTASIKWKVDPATSPDPPGTKETVAVTLMNFKNEVSIVNVFWTDAQGNPIGNADAAGFQVGKDPEYTIFNDLDEPFGVRNLQFLVNVPEIPMRNLIPGSTPGFGDVLPDFILEPHSSRTFNIAGNLDPGKFLYAQGELFDITSSFDITPSQATTPFIHGHQEPIPLPAAAWMGLSLLGGAAGFNKLRRRSQPT